MEIGIFCRDIGYSLNSGIFFSLYWLMRIHLAYYKTIFAYHAQQFTKSANPKFLLESIFEAAIILKSFSTSLFICSRCYSAASAFIIIYHLALSFFFVSICFEYYWIWWCCCWARFMHEWRLHCCFLIIYFSPNEHTF